MFNDLLNETKGFKYQITVKVLLKKYRSNGEKELAPVYFNSSTKTVINRRYKLDQSFQENLYRIDAWINRGSGWIIESIESQYINIYTYRPLVGSSYRDLLIELKHPRNGLTNIKSTDEKCFLWCHFRHINPVKDHPGKIKIIDRDFANNLNYDGIEFPVQEKDFKTVEVQNNICINVFGYENELVFPVYISDQTFKSSINLLLLINDDKFHYGYIKDFNTFMFYKTKNKNKKWFCESCLQCFSSKNVLIKHKEDCLSINGQQSINLEKETIEFKNYFKQLPAPFKIYADFECNFKNVECYKGSYTKMYHEHVPCSYAYKVVCIDDIFSKPIVVYRGLNATYEFIKSILKQHEYCKKIMKYQFNKNLVMTEKEEYLFQQNNNSWICKKIIDKEDEKVRDHCRITSKFRGSAYWDCNINFQLTKKIPVIFHNLKGYDSHLIFSEQHKFNLKFDVISNGLEKYMALFLGRDLVFIDSMQSMNSSLDKLVKNLVNKDFKYLVKEFGCESLELLKQKGAYSYEYINSFKRFNEDKLCARKYFYSSTKDKEITEDSKISDGHVSIKDYMVCEKIWDRFKMKIMDDYHGHYLKKDVLLLANVSEKFIDTCLKYYKLHACHYFSAPGLSWDAMLKMTGI